MSPHYNFEIISQWGREEGTKYLEKSGRIHGWFVYFKKGAVNIKAPPQFFHNIIQYKNHEGAHLTVQIFSTIHSLPNYKLVEDNYPLGDYSRVYLAKEMQSNGKYFIQYRIETAYRNYVSIVAGQGMENEFDFDFMLSIAEIALEKLKSAPLGEW